MVVAFMIPELRTDDTYFSKTPFIKPSAVIGTVKQRIPIFRGLRLFRRCQSCA